MTAISTSKSCFLSKSNKSREECYAIAKSLSSSNDDMPMAIQGVNSYILRGGELVVQFRFTEVDFSVHNKAMETHGSKYVPLITCIQSKSFYVYTSLYHGKRYCEQGISSVTLLTRKNTIVDLVIFFVQRC